MPWTEGHGVSENQWQESDEAEKAYASHLEGGLPEVEGSNQQCHCNYWILIVCITAA